MVGYFILQMIWQVEEELDQIAMDYFGEIFKVDFSLDVSLSEKFVITPRIAIAVAVTVNLKTARQEEVFLILTNLLL